MSWQNSVPSTLNCRLRMLSCRSTKMMTGMPHQLCVLPPPLAVVHEVGKGEEQGSLPFDLAAPSPGRHSTPKKAVDTESVPPVARQLGAKQPCTHLQLLLSRHLLTRYSCLQ